MSNKNINDMTLGEVNARIAEADELRAFLGHKPQPNTSPSLYEGRAVVVIDRGWILAGDQELLGDHLRLTGAVHVFRWESIGFPRMLEEWKSDKCDIRKVADALVPVSSIIFRIPVAKGWGLK
jgi:hypothetical protein